jgi:3-deoxy-manno-octulosonate cytidylyltransferase (CMP-KDO synthetase)
MAKKGAIIIPARYGSTRFPGKPLQKLNGKTLIEHTWRVACEAVFMCPDLVDVIVATDDARIQGTVLEFGGKAVIVDKFCRNGTERVYHAAKSLSEGIGFVVNLQGDACLSDPAWVVGAFQKVRHLSPTGTMPAVATVALHASPGTLDEMIRRQRAGEPTGETTVVLKMDGNAMYFSKAVLPHGGMTVLQHVGIYAYTFPALRWYNQTPHTATEVAEGLEQLRFIQHGIDLGVVSFPEAVHLELNNPGDVAPIEAELARRADQAALN